MSQAQRREYFRVEYPATDRPVVVTRDARFSVIDISEYGVKFQSGISTDFPLGEELNVDIRFGDGEKIGLVGKIIRKGEEEIVVNLAVPIPLRKIRSEHIYLISNYYSKVDD